MLQASECRSKGMIIIKPAIKCTDPHSPLIIFQDRTDGIMAQGSRIFRRKTADTESSRLRFKDKQTFHGSYPNPSFIISGQCPDRVRKEISRSILLVIMMFYLKVVLVVAVDMMQECSIICHKHGLAIIQMLFVV